MSEFENVVPPLAAALQKRGYEALTPVQSAVIAPELAGQDMLVSAQTGSGKTVAFGLAIAPTLLGERDRFAPPEKPLALAIAPTRELALQVKRELEWLYADTSAVITSCVGGMDIRTERRALERGAHIVVGTPGRLRDHITKRAFDTTGLRAVILDEADEMLDLGFKEDLEYILEATPEDRRTLLFSATVPPMIGKLAKQYQRDAVRVQTVEERKQHSDIEYRALVHAPREREHAIMNVLRYYDSDNALVFCNTRATVNHMVARFNNRGFSVVALSGELSQNERTHALQSMRDGRAKVCIATDVAARGIDLPNLNLVVHAELPSNAETLLHRSGRTGRAGRKGTSVLMVDPRGRKKAERLLGWGKLTASWGTPPTADDVLRRDEERLLADEVWSQAPEEDEADFVATLAEKFSVEQLALAYLRSARAGQGAPEDIETVSVTAPSPREFKEKRERAPRDDFSESIWVSLSVGRKQNAEPRWLIPLICNAGDITKKAIGQIKMQPEETFVQLDANEQEKFFEALGPNMVLEKNVRVTRLEGMPKFDNTPYEKPPRFEKPDRKDRSEKPGKRDRDKKPRWDGEKRDARNEQTEKERKPYKSYAERKGNAPQADKKRDKSPANEMAELFTKKPKDADRDKPKDDDKSKSQAGWAKKKPRAAPKTNRAGVPIKMGGKPKGKAGFKAGAQGGKPKGKPKP